MDNTQENIIEEYEEGGAEGKQLQIQIRLQLKGTRQEEGGAEGNQLQRTVIIRYQV